MTHKAWKCAPVFAAIVAAGLATQAHAVPQAYALSYDNVFNGQVFFNPTGNVVVNAPSPNSGSSASVNGSGPSFSVSTDAPVAVCPGGGSCGAGGSLPGASPTNNAFVPYGQAASAGFNYGWGDANIVSQQTVANPTPAPVPCTTSTCFHAVNEGESSVKNTTAAGGGNNGSGTGFILTFTVSATTTVDISLNATPYAQVFLDPTALGSPGDQAAAVLAASATIVNTGTGATVFSFAPDGTLSAFGGTVFSDPFSLNVSPLSSLPAGFGNSIYNPCGFAVAPTGQVPGATAACPGLRVDGVTGSSNYFHVVTNALGPGVYQLRLAAQELTNVERTVPEPTSITLLGLALAGLGLMRRRNNGSRAS